MSAADMELLERRVLLAAYRLVDLGTLGGAKSVAYDINNSNQVVGYTQLAGGADRAFLFKDANLDGIADPGEMVNLGILSGHAKSYAFSINDNGAAVGTSINNSDIRRAVRFQAGGGATDLNVGNGSNAYAINNSNEIVGGASFGAINYSAFHRSASGAVTNLGTLGASPFRSSEAFGINDSGTITGWSGADAGDSAFVRPPGGAMSPIGFAAPPPGLSYSYAWDINTAGQIVGEGFNDAGAYRAFLYQDGVAQDLGVVGAFNNSMALAINGAGEVVGRLKASSGLTHAFVYRGGVMQDLNDLIAPGSGWVLNEARGINDGGSIVGMGTAPGGQTRAFLLVPVQEQPPSVVLSSFQYLTAPHRLTFRFSRDVSASLSTSDLLLRNLTQGTMIAADDVSLSYDHSNDTATITFPGLPRMMLPDGRYRATLLASGIQDTTNVPLDGNGDGVGGDDAIFDFFQLTGDANHDAVVDFADFQVLYANMNQPGDFSQGDFDYSGTVSFADFQKLELMFGTSLPEATSSSTLLAATVAPVTTGSSTQRPPAPKPRPVFAAPVRKGRPGLRSRPQVLYDVD